MIETQRRLLAMFAKYWQPGQVKTRLGGEIGDEVASQLYLRFVKTLLARLATSGDERTLVFAPEVRRQDFESVCEDVAWQLAPQASGDLGHRMSDFFTRQLAGDRRPIVLIGSDSPTLPVRLIGQAFGALEQSDIVLGPSKDGGYYLVAMKDHLPAVFSNIDWSTDRVLQQTLDRIAEAYPRATVQLLDAWYDVDSLMDVRRLHAELLDEESACPVLVELRDLCGAVLGA